VIFDVKTKLGKYPGEQKTRKKNKKEKLVERKIEEREARMDEKRWKANERRAYIRETRRFRAPKALFSALRHSRSSLRSQIVAIFAISPLFVSRRPCFCLALLPYRDEAECFM